MSISSRAVFRDTKTSRTSTKAYGQAPLSGRNMNDNYYPQPAPKSNYASRQFQQGIFANQLSRKAELGRKKDDQRDLPLQLIEVVDHPSLKVRSSKKQYDFPKQSREEFSQNYHPSYQYNGIEQNNRDDMKEQLQFMRQEIQFNVLDKVKKMMNEQSAKVRESISDLINQTNNGFKKKQETLFLLKTDSYNLKDQMSRLVKSYQIFCQESQQKFQNLHVQLSNLGGVKKSRHNGQYNMDLKNSFQGLNSSLSVNLGNQSQSSKLVNEVIFQLDTLKKQLNENKAQIQQVNFRLSSKINEFKSQTKDKSQNKTDNFSLKYQQISKAVKELLKEQRKTSKFDERMDLLQNRFKEIELVVFNQQQNIRGMNEQFTNIVNSQINPKIKKVQSTLVDIYSRIDSNELEKQIKTKISAEFNERMEDTRTVRIRNCSKQEEGKLSVLTGMNEDKITYKQTYFLDDQNYLLDSQGTYLVQQINNKKQRIKIQNEHIYLLQMKGIQIASTS